VRRGEVWWARLGKVVKTRPVLLLSRDAAYARRTHITIAPITRKVRAIDSEVPLAPIDGVREECAVNLDSIQTIYKNLLTNRVTRLSDEKMAAVAQAVRYALDLK